MLLAAGAPAPVPHSTSTANAAAKAEEKIEFNASVQKLVTQLRNHLGFEFLHGVRTIVAHPVRSNLFLRTFRYNHPPKLFEGWSGVRV